MFKSLFLNKKLIIFLVLVIVILVTGLICNIFISENRQGTTSDIHSDDNQFYCQKTRQGLGCQKDPFLVLANSRQLIIKEKDGFKFYLVPQDKLNFSTNQYRFLTLRLKTKTDSTHLQVVFLSRDGGATPLADFVFSRKNNNPTNYYFNLSSFDAWYGIADRFYLKFDPQDLEIKSFALSPATPILMIKSLWQEYFSLSAEGLSWINILPAIIFNATPFLYYIFALTIIILFVLKAFSFGDRTLRVHWRKIFLIIVLLAWFCSEIYFLWAGFLQFKDDAALFSLSNNQKRAILVNRFLQDNSGDDLNNYLNIVKEKVPVGSKIFLPPTTDYRRVILVYDLVDRYQVVGDLNQAQYILSYNVPDADYYGFNKIVIAPNQLIYQKK
jgi:hypothetical protein